MVIESKIWCSSLSLLEGVRFGAHVFRQNRVVLVFVYATGTPLMYKRSCKKIPADTQESSLDHL